MDHFVKIPEGYKTSDRQAMVLWCIENFGARCWAGRWDHNFMTASHDWHKIYFCNEEDMTLFILTWL
jgi:hypothetical protein